MSAPSTKTLRKSTTFRGVRVSRAHHIVLSAAERAGVKFQLNSGRRTYREQEQLVRRLGVWSPSNRTGAARPSHDAPHIRTGRARHALDVRYDDGGARRLASYYRRRGIRVAFNVPGEPWHMDVLSEDSLLAAARRLYGPASWLTPIELRRVRELDAIRRGAPPAHPRREAVLVRELTKQRKRIWRAAQPKPKGDGRGWGHANRWRRFKSLQARTT